MTGLGSFSAVKAVLRCAAPCCAALRRAVLGYALLCLYTQLCILPSAGTSVWDQEFDSKCKIQKLEGQINLKPQKA